MRILLLEDDHLLGDGLQMGLSQQGFTVDWVKRGRDALHALTTETFNAAIFDLGLPDCDGIDILKQYRDRGEGVPILVLTARNDVSDKLTCLDGGADDYLVKPADIRELAARLRALLRRHEGSTSPVIQHKNVRLDPNAFSVSVDGTNAELTEHEFKILHALVRSPGHVVSKEKLEEIIYGWHSEVESNAIQVHLHNLRRKVGSDLIRTVRGVGYVIDR
ncbi:MAG: two-component system response regulator QseB [Parasphingorhabdus sp.]|jgi:two-component system response regulator QseB